MFKPLAFKVRILNPERGVLGWGVLSMIGFLGGGSKPSLSYLFTFKFFGITWLCPMTSRGRRCSGRPFRVGVGGWLGSRRDGGSGFEGLFDLRIPGSSGTSRGITLWFGRWCLAWSRLSSASRHLPFLGPLGLGGGSWVGGTSGYQESLKTLIFS